MAFKHGGCFQVQDSENSSDARLQYIQGVVLNVYIHQALEDIKANKGDDTGEPSLIEMFYDRGCDDATAIVMALDMMFAGIDTSLWRPYYYGLETFIFTLNGFCNVPTSP
jgi:hypothetical protein